uniref:NADH-ubiquinone oxidoreductase chain 4L n=1 Tax=Staphylinidae sp. BMNH 1274665 TaxID=1796589 RepID=A0A126TG22_9COLE|nr:NADH dehydrogenase subunit 4L [Staphylinidae sp. BMNH 1274665]
MLMIISITMLMSGLLVFSLKRKHLLMMLLSLEFMVIALYFNLFIYLNNYLNETYFLMIFLMMSVCEGVLGLSILVSLIRMYGNDYFQTFSMLW